MSYSQKELFTWLGEIAPDDKVEFTKDEKEQIRAVGELLNELDGFDSMSDAWHKLYCRDENNNVKSPAGRMVEVQWDGIGGWSL